MLAPLAPVRRPPGTAFNRRITGWVGDSGVSAPSEHYVPFSARLHRGSPLFFLLLLSHHAIPPTSLLHSAIYVRLFPAGEGVGYSSMWTLSIHDQWRGPALYTKPSRRAGLFYSQPCGFKQIARTGELKQILSCRFQDMQRKQVGINYV